MKKKALKSSFNALKRALQTALEVISDASNATGKTSGLLIDRIKELVTERDGFKARFDMERDRSNRLNMQVGAQARCIRTLKKEYSAEAERAEVLAMRAGEHANTIRDLRAEIKAHKADVEIYKGHMNRQIVERRASEKNLQYANDSIDSYREKFTEKIEIDNEQKAAIENLEKEIALLRAELGAQQSLAYHEMHALYLRQVQFTERAENIVDGIHRASGAPIMVPLVKWIEKREAERVALEKTVEDFRAAGHCAVMRIEQALDGSDGEKP